jgi:hypothetical protein
MNAPAAPYTDAAWAVIDTPLAPTELAAFCSDVERLIRINPLLEIQLWHAFDGARVRMSITNLSNGRQLEVNATIERAEGDAITLRYDSGLKRSTRFEIEPAPCGSRLKIVEDYSGTSPEEARMRADEVDRTLTAWGAALHAYLKLESRWGRYAWWRWYMRRVWLRMKPAGRRVTYILWVVTVIEIVAVALALTIAIHA